jgi:hypothetical protein
MARARDGAADSAADSRSASSGATRDARSAGTRPAPIVTAVPASSEMATIGRTTRPPAGSANPKLSNTPLSRPAIPSPAAIPRTDATMPPASASASNQDRICRLVAPRLRNSAASRVRCATTIENVLAMVNVATSSAIAAKTSSIGAGARGGEQLGEVGVQRVAERESAREEGNAEHDRDDRAGKAALARPQSLDHDDAHNDLPGVAASRRVP